MTSPQPTHEQLSKEDVGTALRQIEDVAATVARVRELVGGDHQAEAELDAMADTLERMREELDAVAKYLVRRGNRCEVHVPRDGTLCDRTAAYRVQVGTRKHDAHRACRQHLAAACDALYAAEGRDATLTVFHLAAS